MEVEVMVGMVEATVVEAMVVVAMEAATVATMVEAEVEVVLGGMKTFYHREAAEQDHVPSPCVRTSATGVEVEVEVMVAMVEATVVEAMR